jgi:hypothetical protein
MTASYSIRLLFVCFASFFVVHAVMSAIVRAFEGCGLRFAERIAPRTAATLLFCMRILPAATAITFVLAVCAPSYVRFEPNMAGEEVGFACAALAMAGALIWAAALSRGLGTILESVRFIRSCRREGRVTSVDGTPAELRVIEEPRSVLLQAGILRPELVISGSLLREFSGAELHAALEHERAHWFARDNFKRLVLAFSPGVVPFSRGLARIEQGWAKFTERAADDCVSASGASAALSLASALLRLARMRATMGEALSLPQAASPLGGSDDLIGRVRRLLEPVPAIPTKGNHAALLWGAGSILMAGCAAILASPTLLFSVHELIERLLR